MSSRVRAALVSAITALAAPAVSTGCAAGLPLTPARAARVGCAEWGEPLMFSGTSWVQSATTVDTARSEAASPPQSRQPSACAPGRQGW